MCIRVAIVENERSVRQELVSLINETPGFQCAGAYSSGEQALLEISKQPPHVVLMDINLGQMSGVACTYLLKQVLPELQIVMLTVYDDRQQIFAALEMGASGYLLKRTPAREILKAIEDVHGGGAPMSSYIARQVVQSFSRRTAVQTSDVALSARELRGQALFQENCAFCHAADGTGRNWIGSFLQPHPRDLTAPAFMRSMTASRLAGVIREATSW